MSNARVAYPCRKRFSFIVVLALCCAGNAIAQDDDDDDHDREMVTRQLGDDRFLAGDEVRLTGEIAGDAIAAGGDVVLDATVRGDVVVTGGEVEVAGEAAEDLYAAGGTVRIGGKVAGNARIAGGDVVIRRAAAIDGGTSIAGGKVRVEGRVGQYLQMTGGNLRIDGTVAGNVEAAGGKLVIGPEADIQGTVTFRGRHAPRVESGAQVRGGVKHIPESREWKRWAGVAGAIALAWLVGWLLVGAVLLFLWPGFSRVVSQTVAGRPGASLLLGFAILVLGPVAIGILMASLIGMPLAIVLLFVYLLLLPFGYLAAALTIAEWMLSRMRKGAPITTAQRVLALLGVLIVLGIVTLIPFIGCLIAFVLVLLGIGGLVLASLARHRGESLAPASG